MKQAIIVATVTGVLCTVSTASATVRNVPADFATIQAAITVSAFGDTVMVAPGTYTVNLDFGSRTIRVLSSGGARVTTLKPAALNLTLIRIAGGGAETELAGFTFDGGAMKHVIEVGSGSQPWIHHNTISNHVSYESNATEIGSYSGGPVLEFNLFIHNRSIGGVGIFGGGGQILNNTFDDCSRGFWSQGSGVIAKNNIVTNSIQFGIGDTRFSELDYNCVYNNNPDYDYGAAPGPNDIAVWPEYCDATIDNYGLDAISPCLGTGAGGADRGAFAQACGADAGPRVVGLAVSGALAMHVIDENPEISWAYFDADGLPQAEAEIEVGSDPDWAVAEMWDPTPFAGSATTQLYAGAVLLDGTTYFIRARVNNGTEWGAWSARLFRTNTSPQAPILSAPSDSAIVYTSSPWLAVGIEPDGDGDPVSIAYEVYADDALTIFVTGANLQPASWKVAPPLTLENQPHWWRARAFDGYELSPWTATRVLILDAVNSVPVPGALIEPIGNGPVPTTAPHFDWDDAADPDPRPSIVSQTLIIATDSQFTFATQVSKLPLSEYVFGGLAVAQRYWWRVRFADDDGAWADSPAERFFIPGPGDMNMNQTLNLVDVVMLIDVVFRAVPQPSAFYLADANGDCVLDVLDVVSIINHAFRDGPLPLAICNPPSGVLNVPGEYPTIENAIANAADDDTVLVAAGWYHENIDFLGKRIHLLSEDGAASTVLEPLLTNDPAVRFVTGEPSGTEVSGFTITGGEGKHAILIEHDSSPYIHHNIVRDHISYVANATAVGSYMSNPTIAYNLFLHTRSLGGIGIFNGGGTIENNTFDDNSRGYWSQGVGVVARNNVVTNSVQFGIGDDGFAVNDYNCTYNNSIEYCCGAVAGPNDFTADPLYCDRLALNFQLSPGSLCIGSGYGGADRGAFSGGCLVPPGGE